MLGEEVKKIRKESKLTQQEFAEKLDVGRSYISDIERGRRKPSQRLVNSIIDKFQVENNLFDAEPFDANSPFFNPREIRKSVVQDMTSLGVYKDEYNTMIDTYSDTIFQYRIAYARWEYEQFPMIDEISGSKHPYVNQVENLRKEIATYSDKLMLNPKSHMGTQPTQESKKSKLADMLSILG